MPELIRLSGYRLANLPPDQYTWRMASLRDEIQKKYLPLLSQLEWGYFLDDTEKSIKPIDVLMSKIQSGELYVVHNEQEFIGMAAITPIQFGRIGYIEAIATPKYQGSLAVGRAAGEIITYAFQPYGDKGLGLKKLLAKVAAPNMQVIQMLGKVGFKPAGILKGEIVCAGVPHDVVLLELLNPQFFAVDTGVIQNERSPISTELQPDILRESSAAGTGTSEYPGSPDTGADRTGSATVRADSAPVAATEQLQWNSEPVSTGGSRRTVRPATDATDAELVSAERDATPSESTNGSKSKSGGRIRKQRSSTSGTTRSRRAATRVPSRTRS
jgi:RimJ/RimL family protein N-acetyltransferase